MSRKRLLGGALLAAVIAFALLGPLHGADPLRQNLSDTLLPPGGAYPLGTDHLGRDLLARLAAGARLSFGFALLAALAAAVPGILLGLVAALRGGVLERLLLGLADAVQALPGLLLVVLFTAFAPGEFLPLYLGLALSLWVEFFRIARNGAAAVMARPQVQAARLLGFGAGHILRRHLWPEVAPLAATLFAFAAGTAVTTIAALAFIGVGARPPVPEWGSMMTELLPYYAEAPLALLLPAILIFTTVLGLHLLAGRERA
ncbi:ABC transporter permease [Roseomonas aerophila]|uniref:ABC transporter permease n=1 Tax=Teichococcus aerophilus TaxID=1224513 RepID=A0ABR7RJS4_9PROT|nr:ABC transporter permease [Pseudoroseomonas aerophila]MBC9206397.1 ABC transporter permease [Pseudoroseomonas aerophila]